MKNLTKCLVTGGAGFIGSHLCDDLLKREYEVYCLDNLITGSLSNISQHKGNPFFHFLNHDVTIPLPKNLKFGLKSLKYIYHLASPASPPFYKKYSVETLLVNSVGTKNMLDLAREANCSFLFSSTSEVYGNPKEHPQKETYFGNVNPIGVRACYDEAKRFGEALCMEYMRKFNTDIKIVRIFNTYGPRMQTDDGRVIVNFVNQAIANKPLIMYGDGSITRSFCYISDMVRGIIEAMENESSSGEVINLGFPEEHTIEEVAKIIVKLVGSSSTIKKGPRQEDDPVRRRPDISKAKKILGWQPNVDLFEGLKKTINYFRAI